MTDVPEIPSSHNNARNAMYVAMGKEIGGLGAAELVSMGVSLGVVAVADQIAPEWQKRASKVIAKQVFEPYLDTIEGGLRRVCKLEECQPDMSKSREERAETLAHSMLVFGAAWATSMAFKIATRKLANRWAGIKEPPMEYSENKAMRFLQKHILPNKHDRHIFYWDEGVHIGSLILMNTVMHKQTDDLIYGSSTVLQNMLGLSKKKADAIASMAVIWELPNVLGFAAGSRVIAKDHLKNFAKQIEEEGKGGLGGPSPSP